MKALLVVVALTSALALVALSDDFKTFDGKEYKNVAVSRIEPDGIIVRSASGIMKLYFSELPQEVRTKYNYDPVRAREFATTEQAQAAAQAPVANVQFEKPPKGGTGEPGVHILRVAGKVLQVLPDGILLASHWENQTLEPFTDERGIYHGGATIMDEPLFILGAPSNLVDGDQFSGVVYPAGTYGYAAVSGARKTIRCYATTRQLAAQRQMTQ